MTRYTICDTYSVFFFVGFLRFLETTWVYFLRLHVFVCVCCTNFVTNTAVHTIQMLHKAAEFYSMSKGCTMQDCIHLFALRNC